MVDAEHELQDIMTPPNIIAVEEHVATDAFLDAAHRLEVAPAERRELELMRRVERQERFRAALTDIATRIAAMDAAGQAMAVLSINPPGVQPYPAADAVPVARAVNDDLAAIVRRHPYRFGALGTVTPQAVDAATEEIERIMGPLGLNGVMINSHTHGRYLDEPQFEPILAAAQEYGAPIYLHPRFPSTLAPYDVYGLQAAIWGYQAEAGLHAMRLIVSGVFDKYPALTIVLGHLGEGIPFWLRRIDNRHAFAAQVPGSAGPMPALELTPSEYFRRNFVLTTSGIDDPAVLDLALDAVGDDNIMFAVDTPYEDTAAAVRFLRDAPLTDTQRTNIAYRTAERVFGLECSAPSGVAPDCQAAAPESPP
ncbi:amidohydrolase family protein [Mycolicibacterium goodii]|uniref:amidohydrolase family protein n=1 Tax=Mycolicibacterium goodii TaxID=134601 RepID=UPI001BDCD510|nr:amidohydrolase family protein [Mycolicibacterium goodii]MBU8828764.1 amidohydrolase family protein [Mycolicibacterium goodii]